MSLRLLYAFVPGEFDRTIRAIETPVAKAATAAITEARDIVQNDVRAAIGGAGFSRRWQNIFKNRLKPKNGPPVINAAVTFFDNSFFINLFSQGGTHTGKPLMWLPLDTVPFAAGHTRLTPKQYVSRVGPLVSGGFLRRTGKQPILFGKTTNAVIVRATKKRVQFRKKAIQRGITRGAVNVPLFVGVSTVHIGKKFDVNSIIERVASQIGELYLKHIKAQT